MFIQGDMMEEYLHEEIRVREELPAQINIIEEENSYGMPRHWHRSLEVDYLIHVKAKVYLNGREMAVDQPTLVVVNSGEIHRFETVDETDMRVINLLVSYDFLKKICRDIDSYTFVMEGNIEKEQEIRDTMESLYSLRKSGKGEFDFLRENELIFKILYLLFTYFKQEKRALPVAETEKYVERFKVILEYVNERYKEDLSLESVAAYYGISREHLARNFRKYMGTTWKEYLDGVRMSHAFTELMNTDLSVLEIALNNGFPDDRAFSRYFKQIYHTTPYKYKKEHKQCLAISKELS